MELTFRAADSKAEYEGFITGLVIAKSVGVASLKFWGDSQLIVDPVKKGECNYMRYNDKVPKGSKTFGPNLREFHIEAIPRESNQEADALCKYSLGASKIIMHYVKNILCSITMSKESLGVDKQLTEGH